MEIINDEELDVLLHEAVQRSETVNEINKSVMTVVCRESRKVKVKKIIRLLAFCLGVPLMLFLPVMGLLLITDNKMTVTTLVLSVSLVFFYVPVLYRINDIFKQPVI